MNVPRLALAAVVAWLVDGVFGFLIYGQLIAGRFAAYPGVFRAADRMPIPVMLLGSLIGMFALAYVYAKGYEGGSGAAEGVRFGAAIGIVFLGIVWMGDYAILNIGRRLAVMWAVTGFIEILIVGLVLGALYKPAAAAGPTRAATV